MTFSISVAERPLAYNPPTTAPMLVPAMASIGTCSCSRTFNTPTCATPRAPPPDSTKPTRRRCGGGENGTAERFNGAPTSGTACASVTTGAASH